MLSGISSKLLKNKVFATRNLTLFPAIELEVILGRYQARLTSMTQANSELLKHCFSSAKDIYKVREDFDEKKVRDFSFCTRVADTIAHLGLPPTAVAASLMVRASDVDVRRIGEGISRHATLKLFEDAKRLVKCAKIVADLPFSPSDTQRETDVVAQRWQDFFNGYCRRVAKENNVDEASLKYLACVINHQSMALASPAYTAENLEILEKKLRLLIAPVVERDCRRENRLYPSQIRHDLFRQCRPDDYLIIRTERRSVLGMSHPEIKSLCKDVVGILERSLRAIGIEDPIVTYREKSYDSIVQKKGARSVGVKEQDDLIGFRIVLPSIEDFYSVMNSDILSLVGKRSERDSRIDKLGNVRVNVSIPVPGTEDQFFTAEINLRTAAYQIMDDEGNEKILPHTGLTASKAWKQSGFTAQVVDRHDTPKSGNLSRDVPAVSQNTGGMIQVLVPESIGQDISPGRRIRTDFRIIELPAGSTIVDLFCHKDFDKPLHKNSPLILELTQVNPFSPEIRVNGLRRPSNDYVLETGDIIAPRRLRSKEADHGSTHKNMLLQVAQGAHAKIKLGSYESQGRGRALKRGMATLSEDYGDLSTPEIKKALTQFAERWGFQSLDDLFIGLAIWKDQISRNQNAIRNISPNPDDIKRELSHRFVKVGVSLDESSKTLYVDFDEDQMGLLAHVLRGADSIGLEITSAGTTPPKEGFESRVYVNAVDASQDELLRLRQMLKSICVPRDRANKLRISDDLPTLGFKVQLLNEKGSLLMMAEKLASMRCLISNLTFLSIPIRQNIHDDTYGIVYLELKANSTDEEVKRALLELEIESSGDQGPKLKHCVSAVETQREILGEEFKSLL